MLSAGQQKLLRSLQLSKFRKIHGAFLAEGPVLVGDILNSSLNVREIFATAHWLQSSQKLLPDIHCPVQAIDERELRAISALTTPNQVVAVVNIPQPEPEPTMLTGSFSLFLDEIRDPGNLGTILRTADWFGIENVFCSKGCVDVYNPKVVQATMGSIARIKTWYMDPKKFLENLPAALPVIGMSLDGSDIRETRFTEGIIIIGNEARGIHPSILPFLTHKIRIPSYPNPQNTDGKPESLNASVACAIACYEFRRHAGISSLLP